MDAEIIDLRSPEPVEYIDLVSPEPPPIDEDIREAHVNEMELIPSPEDRECNLNDNTIMEYIYNAIEGFEFENAEILHNEIEERDENMGEQYDRLSDDLFASADEEEEYAGNGMLQGWQWPVVEINNQGFVNWFLNDEDSGYASEPGQNEDNFELL